MKIVFLNVWGDEMRDTLPSYVEEQSVDTDIFCFQEATSEMKQRCADVLKGYHEISDFKYIADNDNFPQSVFVKNTLDLASHGTLLGDDMRVGLAVFVEIMTPDGSVFLCNVHGSARPAEKLDNADRIRFSQVIIEFFEEKNIPVIIGGDFNLERKTDSIMQFERAGYRNLIEEYAVATTRNHFAWDRYPGNEMYYSDYVFLNDKVKLQAFRVEENEVSDHLPMIVVTS